MAVTTRREFLLGTGVGAALQLTGSRVAAAAPRAMKPPRLRAGDVVGVIHPVGTPLDQSDLTAVTAAFEWLGLRVRCGQAAQACARGIAVDERARAAEITALFEDTEVRAIVPVRGGWGTARLLPHLAYDVIQRHPKVVMGFSDAAALLLGIHARTGLVTFHGPMGISAWDPFTVAAMRRVLFAAEPAALGARDAEGDTACRTLSPGRARGRLLGGNLTVVASMIGSPYLAAPEDPILFLEEVREPTSEVDRMLTQLELAGLLPRARGVVFGQCTRCAAPELDRSLTLEHVLADHLSRRGVPAWQGAPIGHGERQLTVPIGVPVEIDAARGVIQLLEPAVT